MQQLLGGAEDVRQAGCDRGFLNRLETQSRGRVGSPGAQCTQDEASLVGGGLRHRGGTVRLTAESPTLRHSGSGSWSLTCEGRYLLEVSDDFCFAGGRRFWQWVRRTPLRDGELAVTADGFWSYVGRELTCGCFWQAAYASLYRAVSGEYANRLGTYG